MVATDGQIDGRAVQPSRSLRAAHHHVVVALSTLTMMVSVVAVVSVVTVHVVGRLGRPVAGPFATAQQLEVVLVVVT